jgi:hypothetical protein
MKIENMNVASGANVNIISDSTVTINHDNTPKIENKIDEQKTIDSQDFIEPVEVIDEEYNRILDKGKPYFDKAIEKGYISINGSNYLWKESKVLLAYFCGKIYCGDTIRNGAWIAGNEGFFPDKQLSLLFTSPQLGASRRKKLLESAPVGHKKIEGLFY